MTLQICGTSQTDENFPTKNLISGRKLQEKQVLLTFVIRILFSCLNRKTAKEQKTNIQQKKNRVYAIDFLRTLQTGLYYISSQAL